jgi:hypothetical protein
MLFGSITTLLVIGSITECSDTPTKSPDVAGNIRCAQKQGEAMSASPYPGKLPVLRFQLRRCLLQTANKHLSRRRSVNFWLRDDSGR